MKWYLRKLEGTVIKQGEIDAADQDIRPQEGEMLAIDPMDDYG